uniref:Uncharacterized protein n=1 Tax=Arundo donax TaxID=35708 RepID=A0A0A9DEQ9_ARUDO
MFTINLSYTDNGTNVSLHIRNISMVTSEGLFGRASLEVILCGNPIL